MKNIFAFVLALCVIASQFWLISEVSAQMKLVSVYNSDVYNITRRLKDEGISTTLKEMQDTKNEE